MQQLTGAASCNLAIETAQRFKEQYGHLSSEDCKCESPHPMVTESPVFALIDWEGKMNLINCEFAHGIDDPRCGTGLTAQEFTEAGLLTNVPIKEESSRNQIQPLRPFTQWLYRMFNDDGELLYVGITSRRWQRWREHEKSQPWIQEATVFRWQGFYSRTAVERAERDSIREEKPKYNVVFNRND